MSVESVAYEQMSDEEIIALAKAGTEVYHAGLYGAEAQFLLDKMQTAGVDTSLLRLGEGANGHAIIQVDENGQNCIILYGGTNRQITEAYVDEVLAHFEAGDVLVLQNEINCMPYIMKRAHEKGLRIAFNAEDVIVSRMKLFKIINYLIQKRSTPIGKSRK